MDPLPHDAASRAHRDEIDAFWREHFGRSVDPTWHFAFAKLCGTRDVRWIPFYEWWDDVLPFFNDLKMRRVYRDKSLSGRLLDLGASPRAVLERVRGRYYAAGAPLSPAAAADRLRAGPHELVAKPSRADNGSDVRRFELAEGELFAEGNPWALSDLEATYGANFVVQERLRQHPRMAAVHPHSINTLRLVTLRWQEEVRLLLAFVRFGTGGRVTDNASTGGICCGIDDAGRLNDSAVDRRGHTYDKHPDTDHAFSEPFDVPNWDAFPREALRLHAQVRHFDLVSWDFAVGEAAEPVFLEMNFLGDSDLYQHACRRPLFGDLTAEVLEAIRDARES